ncbi:MAG: peptidase C1 [Bacteroidota bacterium]
MKKIVTFLILFIATVAVYAQDEAKYKTYEPGFYHRFILRDVRAVKAAQEDGEKEKYLVMDHSDKQIPDDPDDYTRMWAQPSISQGNAGTCWAYGGTSFVESEHKRLGGDALKLSEMFTVYWEYVEKARRYVKTRGESNFTQGSQANAVTRMIKMHGAVPESAYSGLKGGRKYHSHEEMMKEMQSFLTSVKEDDAWNEKAVISTIQSIMHHHMGEPPAEFEYSGETFTPESFRNEVLKFRPEDYTDVMSTMAVEYGETGLYDVPDNWWKSDAYYNLELDAYMDLLQDALENGYTAAIGGDVSEAGFSRKTNAAMIPDFDIESKNINAAAREFRFANKSTTDDHIMHIIGFQKFKGDIWYLVKDSSSGSRNTEKDAAGFGYYFMHEDYIKLKILTFTVHKSVLNN